MKPLTQFNLLPICYQFVIVFQVPFFWLQNSEKYPTSPNSIDTP